MFLWQFYTGRRPLEEAVDISETRGVRRASVAGLVSLLIALGVAPRAVGQTPASETPEPRALQTLTAGWRFVQDDAMTDEVALAATGDGWTAVSLPHTWNATDAASTNATVPYKRGRGWYRLAFDAPARGARHWLQFDGASLVADVWLNRRAYEGGRAVRR